MNTRVRDFAIRLGQALDNDLIYNWNAALFQIANDPPSTWTTEAKKLHDALDRALPRTAGVS